MKNKRANAYANLLYNYSSFGRSSSASSENTARHLFAPLAKCKRKAKPLANRPASLSLATLLSIMTSRYVVICIVFASIIYQSIAFASQYLLSLHRRIASNVHIRQSLLESTSDDDCHRFDDDQSDDDQGKKVRFRSRVSYCGTPFCGYVVLLFLCNFQPRLETFLMLLSFHMLS